MFIRTRKHQDALQDIQARQAILEAERVALQGSMAMVELTATGEVLGASAPFLRMTGYSLDEIIGKPHSMFCEPAYVRSGEHAALWQQLGRGESAEAQFLQQRREGGGIWVEASYVPVCTRGAGVQRIVQIVRDRHERVPVSYTHLTLPTKRIV